MLKKIVRGNNIEAIIGIILSLLLVPIGMLFKPILVYMCGLYVFWMALSGKKGYGFVLIAIASCIPTLGTLDNSNLFDSNLRHIYNTLRIDIICIFILQYSREWRIKHSNFFRVGFLMIFLIILYDFNTYSIAINNFIYVTLIFFVCYKERLSFVEIFRLFVVFYLCHVFYALMQYYFQISPYSFIYEITNLYEFSKRHHSAYGLFGHYLILATITLLMQSMLFLYYIMTKKFNWLIEFIILYITILTTARTAIIVLVIEFLLFFFLTDGRKRFRVVVSTVVILLIGYFFVSYFLQDVFSFVVERFSHGADHRMAAFPSVMAMWEDNILGVGPGQIYKKIKHYAHSGLIEDLTLDNFFLTQIAAYGVFAIIPIINHLIFLVVAIKKRRQNRDLFIYMAFLFTPWILIAFSFDLEAYASLNITFYGIAGMLYVESESKERSSREYNKTN